MLTIGDGQGQDREAASSNPVATFPRQMMDGIITLGKATPHPATLANGKWQRAALRQWGRFRPVLV